MNFYLQKIVLSFENQISKYIDKKYFVLFFYILSGTLSLGLLIFRSNFLSAPDVAMHIFNVQQYAKEFQAGVFYPRWLGDWYGGYGAPIGVVYSPLVYFVAGLTTSLGLSVSLSLKLVVFISLVVSGYYLFKLSIIFYHPFAALLAGVVYQFAPYRIFDLYGRGALPEYVAFMWLPLLLYLGYQHIKNKRSIYIVWIALCFAGLIFTHFQIAILSLPVYVLAFGYFWLRSGTRSLWDILGLFAAFLIGATITTIYWLPAFLENKYINTGWLHNLVAGQLPVNQEWGNYLNNFLFGAQAYENTIWDALYGTNLQIGIGAIFGLFVIIWAIYINIYTRRHSIANDYHPLLLSILGLLGMFMSFDISRPVWMLLHGMEVVMFPWRWQTITAFAVAFLFGYIFDVQLTIVGNNYTNESRLGRMFFIPVFLLIGYFALSGLVMINNRGHLPDALMMQFDGSKKLTVDYYDWVFDDLYVPKQSVGFDYEKQPVLAHLVLSKDQETSIKVLEKSSSRVSFETISPSSTSVNVRTFWFPGWVAFINGEEVNVGVNPDDGTILINVPKGLSTVEVTFIDTPVRVYALWISFIGVVLVGCMLVISVFKSVGQYSLREGKKKGL